MQPYEWLKDISNFDALIEVNPNKEVILQQIHTNLSFENDFEELEDFMAFEFRIKGLPVFVYASKKLSLPTFESVKATQWSTLKNPLINNQELKVDDMHFQNQTLKPLYAGLNGTNKNGILYYYLTHYGYAYKTRLEKMEIGNGNGKGIVFITLNFMMGRIANISAKLDPSIDRKLFVERKEVTDQKDEKSIVTLSQIPVNPIKFLTMANCEARLKSIILGKILGKGSFSEVSEAKLSPEEKTFGYALKISILQDPDADLEILERDNYFLNVLQSGTFQGKQVVPKLIKSWLCNNSENKMFTSVTVTDFTSRIKVTAYTLLERWDGDMAFLGEQRTGSRTYAFTPSELLKMFQLALILGEQGIVHGDLKPDQFLYKNGGKDMVVADFGFAGGRSYKYKNAYMGWPSQARELGCPAAFTALLCPVNCEKQTVYIGFCQYQNIMQLESSLLVQETFVIEEGKAFDKNNATAFAGLATVFTRNSPFNFCPGYSDELLAKRMNSQKKFFQLPLSLVSLN